MYVIFAFPVTENLFDTDTSPSKFQDKPNSPPEGRLPDATKGEYSWNILQLETVGMCVCVLCNLYYGLNNWSVDLVVTSSFLLF